MFDWLIDGFVSLILLFNEWTGNFGLAIILFAALIKIMLYPLTKQQYQSMKRMQELKPLMEEIQKKYEHDKERQAQEMMKFYSEQNFNPLGGCLPMLVQMPFLIFIYQAILSRPELFSNAYFLWIHPGPLQNLYPTYFASSLAGKDLPLILFYGLNMFLSQMLSSTSAQGPQRYIGMFMSVFFTIMMWSWGLPSALILYWSCFMLFTIIQQSFIMHSSADKKEATSYESLIQ